MTSPTPLNQAALAVLEATEKQTDLDFRYAPQIAAAALRAAAEELHYKEQLGWTGYGYYTHFQNQIRALAAELEGAQ